MKFHFIGVACLALFICTALSARGQQPPEKQKQLQIPKDRKDAGVGKPALFSRSLGKKDAQAGTPLRQKNIYPVLKQLFADANIGDSIELPFGDAQILRGVIMSINRKDKQFTSINVKVINYQNAIMRIAEDRKRGASIFTGIVHHPDFSDGLQLRTENNEAFFTSAAQFNIINE
jgi:hypothetical protein